MTRVLAALSADAVLACYAYLAAAALVVRGGAPVELLDTTAVLLPWFVAVHAASLAAAGGYDFHKHRSESDVAFSAMVGVCAATGLSFVLSVAYILYYAPEAQVVARSVFVAAGMALVLVLPGWRMWHTRKRRRRGELNSRVLVVGDVHEVQAVGDALATYSRSGHEIVGYVVETEAAREHWPSGVVGVVDHLERLVREHDAGEVLVLGDCVHGHQGRLLTVLQVCERAALPVHVLPGFYEAVVGRLGLYEIGGVPLVGLRPEPLRGGYGWLKRSMDIGGALAGLVLAAPIMLVTAAAIKLDSAGPVFYRQTRLGLKGRPFQVVKFRSMRADAEKDTGPVWAGKGDPRVTRVGRFLRNKRIDEIPQFWNVLRGEMSLVGPRPERPAFVEQFSEQAPLFPLRMRVRPGITSLSHIMGRYDSTPAQRLVYDLVYLNEVSLAMDLRIIILTVKIVLTGRGAQ